MSDEKTRIPILQELYHRYLSSEDYAAFIREVSRRYTTATLGRLAGSGDRDSRRAAILAIGLVGDYASNQVVGRALSDPDRGVRRLAENCIRRIWCRTGDQTERQELGIILRLNSSKLHREAVVQATELIERAPHLAEAWNQRAIAQYRLGRFAESIGDCRQALELNPYHFAAAAGMGQCYLEVHDRTRAMECFERALKLNPGLEGVRARIAQLRRQKKE